MTKRTVKLKVSCDLSPVILVQETKPGQRLFLTVRNFLAVFLLISVGFGFIYTIFGDRITTGVPTINSSLFLGLVIGLFYGGFTLIQHYVLRFVMAISNLLPWRLVPFLDYCTERIFLRRVGGGYIFVHRLLMEHFADMYPEQTQSLSNIRN